MASSFPNTVFLGVKDLVAGGRAASTLGRLNAGEIHVFYSLRTPTDVAPLRFPVVPSLRNNPKPFSEITNIEYVLPAGSDGTSRAVGDLLLQGRDPGAGGADPESGLVAIETNRESLYGHSNRR